MFGLKTEDVPYRTQKTFGLAGDTEDSLQKAIYKEGIAQLWAIPSCFYTNARTGLSEFGGLVSIRCLRW